MKVYISGPMTGVEDLNHPAFNEAASWLRSCGHEVVNPAELGEPDGWTWEQFLRRDLRYLLECDAIFLLPGWHASRGANLEQYVAVKLGLAVLR